MVRSMKIKSYLPWFFVILWMAVIFTLSHQPAVESNTLSSGLTEKIIVIIRNISNREIDLEFFNHIIRKSAHFTAYLILAVLVMKALRRYIFKRIIIAQLICIIYSISDEFHQLFIQGRSGQISDVSIDSLGALTGIIIFLLLTKLILKTEDR